MHATCRAVINTDVGTVFNCFVDPTKLTEWWPSGAETDPRPGGDYHLWWDGPDWHLRGRYIEVERPHRLVWTWKWDHDDVPARIVTVDLTREEGSTVLEIDHEATSPDERDSYVDGWNHFLTKLEGRFEIPT